MRLYLYLLAGLCSALIGWNIGQFFCSELLGFLHNYPEVIIFPCVAIALSVGMVLNEIFISNPTRLTLCWRKAKLCLPAAIALGAGIGLAAGILYQILLLPLFGLPAFVVRIIGWLTIGLAVGLAEGITWYWRSMEAGDPKRFRQRRKASLQGALAASFIAALLFELIRALGGGQSEFFKAAEDPLGFSILGLLLGGALSLASSPGYLAALRAGAGFEYTEYNDRIPAKIRTAQLKFVTESTDESESEIEEGLSIQLPDKGNIIIGSPDNPQAHICLPGVSTNMGFISLKDRQGFFKPSNEGYRNTAIDGSYLTSSQSVRLRHNSILTFITTPNPEDEYRTTIDLEKNDGNTALMLEKKIYRFVYYNRFLDPEA